MEDKNFTVDSFEPEWKFYSILKSTDPNEIFKKIDLGPLKEYYNKFDYVFREKAIDILDNISKNLQDVEGVSESGKYVELSSPSELDVVSITQLTNGRIKALDVYEGSDQFLCAAGAENGEIGLWIGNNKTVRMRIHNSAVNDVKLGKEIKNELEEKILDNILETKNVIF